MEFKKYLFLDRDGTLLEEPEDFQVDTFEKFKLLPDVIPSLLSLQKSGFRLVIVSNQDGLGTETYPKSSYEKIQNLLMNLLQSQGIQIEAVLICPHFERDKCFCRKPNIGLVRDYLALPELDRRRSVVIGDRSTDLALAENMGIQGIKLQNRFGWKQVSEQLLSTPRQSFLTRKTKETEIQVRINLDHFKLPEISTGIGFFNHMLEQLGYHGGLSLSIQAQGDLHIDDHHLIEDTAITLGKCLRHALGDKIGIERFGFYLPMDDSSTQVAIDLSGRNYFKFQGNLSCESIGGISTEMIPHFFRSFAEGLGANIHIRVEGENTHHQIESLFKAVGRSLRTAISLTRPGEIPSTKGIL